MRAGWAVLFALCVGCGDDGDSGGEAPDSGSDAGARAGSGVAASARVVELPEAQLKLLCRWLADGDATRSVQAECESNAVQDAQLNDGNTQSCEQARDACIAEGVPKQTQAHNDALARCDGETLAITREDCSLLAGDLERCQSAYLAGSAAYVKQFSCARIAESAQLTPFVPPDFCQGIASTCWPTGN